MQTATGIVKNNTGIPQFFGRYEVAPHSFGEMPLEICESLLRHPIKELTVIQSEVGNGVFRRTEHWPNGIRYQERAHAATHRR
jgi:hypothetical protein